MRLKHFVVINPSPPPKKRKIGISGDNFLNVQITPNITLGKNYYYFFSLQA